VRSLSRSLRLRPVAPQHDELRAARLKPCPDTVYRGCARGQAG